MHIHVARWHLPCAFLILNTNMPTWSIAEIWGGGGGGGEETSRKLISPNQVDCIRNPLINLNDGFLVQFRW